MIRVAALARPRVASSFGRAAVPRASLAGAAQDSWEVAVTPSNFAAEVMESPVPVILDCTASWCPPCKQLKPLLQRAVADADGKLKLAVLDTDAHPQLDTDESYTLEVPAADGATATARAATVYGALRALETFSQLVEWAPDLEDWTAGGYVIEGAPGTDYVGGCYHGILRFPPEYPLKPPSVLMLTASGRFKTNRRLCLSMSDFHPETWNPMWSVSSILKGIQSFMADNEITAGSIKTSEREKRKFAKESIAWLVKNAQFRKVFPELVDTLEEEERKRKEENDDANE